jgi:hypothetical protein
VTQPIVTEPLNTQAAMVTIAELMIRVRPTQYVTQADTALGILHSLLGAAHSQVALIGELQRVQS